MARKPTPMRHIKAILRLKHQNQLSIREIVRSCCILISTVGDYIKRAEATGLSWPAPEAVQDGVTKLMVCAKPTPSIGIITL